MEMGIIDLISKFDFNYLIRSHGSVSPPRVPLPSAPTCGSQEEKREPIL
jgi:hypothetical protein